MCCMSIISTNWKKKRERKKSFIFRFLTHTLKTLSEIVLPSPPAVNKDVLSGKNICCSDLKGELVVVNQLDFKKRISF